MPLTVGKSDRDLLLEELDVFTRSLPSPEARARYTDLARAVEAGQVDEPSLRALEQMLEIVLQSGRARRVHGPQAEQALLRLFRQTEGGAAIHRATEAANQALAALQGHTIEALAFSAQTPGVYRLLIDTDRCQVTLAIDREGVWVENVAVGI